VQHGETASRLLVPADQDAAEAIDPGMLALNDLALGSCAGLAPILGLFAVQVQREAELGAEARGSPCPDIDAAALSTCT
jgi:hypothetical protein